MAMSLNFARSTDEVLFEGNSCVKEVILNRPRKMNSVNHEMIYQIIKNLASYKNDPLVKLVILKANGKTFCAGGDVISLITTSVAGHWSFAASYYRKKLTLDHLIATYKKPVVCLINGVVIGAGTGLSMTTTFRVVTEKAAFVMPEASFGHFPDVGASYFLSRLPSHFGEYLGLTGARLDGAEMVACGLATHFVPSKRLHSLENALKAVTTSDMSSIASLINQFTEKAYVKQHSPFTRLDIINKCFSKGTVDDIIESLENEIENIGTEEWITNALNYMRASSPTSLKIFLRSVREGRVQKIGQCLIREYNIACHLFRRTVTNDLYEGTRAKFFDKDKKPMWEPSKLELVSKEMVDQHFKKVEEDEWETLQLPNGSNIRSKL